MPAEEISPMVVRSTPDAGSAMSAGTATDKFDRQM